MNSKKLMTAIALTGLLAGLWVTTGTFAATSSDAADFQGYWMGTDPLDGGDSRRGFVVVDDDTVRMAGRDSFLTLCDGTDRGLASFDDGVVDDAVLSTDNFLLECFNNGAQVMLKARYELLDDAVMIEILTTQTGAPVTEIFFYRVSDD